MNNDTTTRDPLETRMSYSPKDKTSNKRYNDINHNVNHSQIMMTIKQKRSNDDNQQNNNNNNNNIYYSYVKKTKMMQISYLWMLLIFIVSISTFTKLFSTTMKKLFLDYDDYNNNNLIPMMIQNDMNNGIIIKPPSYKICTSPERHVPWPFITNNNKTVTNTDQSHNKVCGLGNEQQTTKFTKYIKSLQIEFQNNDCNTVIYGVAFGIEHIKFMNEYKDETKRLQNNKCFYMFILQNDYKEIDLVWYDRIIQVPMNVLPYQNLRRNVKLFKYSGHLIFTNNVKEIIWQDAKFFSKDNLWKQPLLYYNDYSHNNNNIISNPNACVTVTSLPVHYNSLGDNIYNYTTKLSTSKQYMYHCQTIILALKKRPKVTDSPNTLLQQCQSYIYEVTNNNNNKRNNDEDIGILNAGLLDSAFIVWNYTNINKCYNFNVKLQCLILNQIHCHSDRDQVSIPFTFHQMNLQINNNNNQDIDSRSQDIQLIDKKMNNSDNVMVHMIRSQCHWYFSRIGDCPSVVNNNNNNSTISSVAVMVAGSLQRFQFNSTLHHLLKPAYRSKFKMDYFVALTTAKPTPFRHGNHMNHLSYDPIFLRSNNNNNVYNLDKQEIIKEQLSRLNVYNGGVDVRYDIPTEFYDNDVNSTLSIMHREAKRIRPNEDVYTRFPMLDVRDEYSKRKTAIGNKNMLNLFYRYEYLWVNKVLVTEHMLGQQYDYVLILRDDTLWIEDVNIQSIINYDKGNAADLYILSCDARNPPLLPCEINDHAILVKRSKAEIFTKYYTTLLSININECHTNVQKLYFNNNNDRGCNSEMILYYIIQTYNVTVQLIPQSLLPFQRALTIRHIKDGKIETCLHKYCQSIEQPLHIPKHIRYCHDLDIQFSTHQILKDHCVDTELPVWYC